MTDVIVPAYTPGEWLAVVTHGCVALLPAGTAEATLHRVWDSLRSTDDAVLVDHLQVLAVDGLTHLPPFALVSVVDGRLHAAVRGGVEVDVTAAAGTRVLTAPHVSTWSEEVVEGLAEVTVRAPGTAPDAVVGTLPLVSGVVRASAVRLVLVPAGAAAGEATEAADPAPAEPPAPPPVALPAVVPVTLPVAVPTVVPTAVPTAVATVPPVTVPAMVTTALARVPSPVPAGDLSLGTEAVHVALAPEPDGEPFDNTLLRPVTGEVPVLARTPGEQPAHGGAGAAPAADADTAPRAETATGPDNAPRPAPAADAEPLTPAGSTDHDGTTVLGGDVVALRSRLPEWSGHALTGPLVVPAPATPRPARLALSTGERVVLSRPVLIGRAPQASRVTSAQVPRLVTVPSPLQDISRTHAEVRMDGDDVVLTDLCSTNGVLVVRPAAAPQRLQPGEATVLLPGVLVDLGEDITFTVERSA